MRYQNSFYGGGKLLNLLEEKSSDVLNKVLNTGEKMLEHKLNEILNKRVGSGMNPKLKAILNKKNTLYGKGLKDYKK